MSIGLHRTNSILFLRLILAWADLRRVAELWISPQLNAGRPGLRGVQMEGLLAGGKRVEPTSAYPTRGVLTRLLYRGLALGALIALRARRLCLNRRSPGRSRGRDPTSDALSWGAAA
jgi:hypothetical protein